MDLQHPLGCLVAPCQNEKNRQKPAKKRAAGFAALESVAEHANAEADAEANTTPSRASRRALLAGSGSRAAATPSRA